MDNAFETAELIVEDFNQGSQSVTWSTVMYTVHIAYLNIMMNIPERDGPVFQVFVMYG